jgi:hypothetical protein
LPALLGAHHILHVSRIRVNKITELCLIVFRLYFTILYNTTGASRLKVILGQIHNLVYISMFLTGLTHRSLCGDVMNSRVGEGSPFECRGREVGIRALYTGNIGFESQSAYRPSLEANPIFLRFRQRNAGTVRHIRLRRLYLQFILRSDRVIIPTDGTVTSIINEINICLGAIRLNNTPDTVQDICSNPLVLTTVPIDISRSSCWAVMRNYVVLWQKRQLDPPGLSVGSLRQCRRYGGRKTTWRSAYQQRLATVHDVINRVGVSSPELHIVRSMAGLKHKWPQRKNKFGPWTYKADRNLHTK